MNVLSLFDGISCGQIALEKANIIVNNYFASEIDKDAIKVTNYNYPKTKQIGDVTRISFKNLPKIDLLMGGSPCQGFSFAGKVLNFMDERSKLFFEFIRLLDECKPTYFLFENVVMNKKIQTAISNSLKVEPILINSKLVSAQNRNRLYWTNIPNVTQPADKNISVSDIIGTKAIGAASRARYINGKNGKTQQKIELRKDNKANTITTVKKNCMYTKNNTIHNFTRNQFEELQTIPTNYTAILPEYKAIKCIGNGWTVDIVTHIFNQLSRGNL